MPLEHLHLQLWSNRNGGRLFDIRAISIPDNCVPWFRQQPFWRQSPLRGFTQKGAHQLSAARYAYLRNT
jgi:hypothetical protein